MTSGTNRIISDYLSSGALDFEGGALRTHDDDVRVRCNP